MFPIAVERSGKRHDSTGIPLLLRKLASCKDWELFPLRSRPSKTIKAPLFSVLTETDEGGGERLPILATGALRGGVRCNNNNIRERQRREEGGKKKKKARERESSARLVSSYFHVLKQAGNPSRETETESRSLDELQRSEKVSTGFEPKT